MSTDINQGYFKYITGLKQNIFLFRALSFILGFARALFFLLVVFYSAVLLIFLRISGLFYKKKIGAFHREAASLVDEFVTQYPFHYYPILAKSYCLLLARKALKESPENERLLEVAAGEGSLSSKLFKGLRQKPVGFDINPHSLVKCGQKGHFSKLIISDCLRLPVADGCADTLLAMNFLHHVTNKADTLEKWSRVAKKIIFNENTVYWASSSVLVYALNFVGLSKIADKLAGQIQSREMQCLWKDRELDEMVDRYFKIGERASFLSEFPFFLCNISSALMIRVYGPPTPAIIRALSKGILLSLTRAVAQELIYLDAACDRKKDAFIFYTGESRQFKTQSERILYKCPDCGKKLDQGSFVCHDEQKKFSYKDGMLFLLPEKSAAIFSGYDSKTADLVASEHL